MGTTDGSMLSSEDSRWGVKRGAYENKDQKKREDASKRKDSRPQRVGEVEALVEEFPKLSRAGYGTTDVTASGGCDR